MGKAAKTHRLKVQKRNNRLKHTQNKISKEWNEAMKEQMDKLKEEFAKMSAMTENDITTETTNEETTSEESSLGYDKVLEDETKVEISGFHNVTEND